MDPLLEKMVGSKLRGEINSLEGEIARVSLWDDDDREYAASIPKKDLESLGEVHKGDVFSCVYKIRNGSPFYELQAIQHSPIANDEWEAMKESTRKRLGGYHRQDRYSRRRKA